MAATILGWKCRQRFIFLIQFIRNIGGVRKQNIYFLTKQKHRIHLTDFISKLGFGSNNINNSCFLCTQISFLPWKDRPSGSFWRRRWHDRWPPIWTRSSLPPRRNGAVWHWNWRAKNPRSRLRPRSPSGTFLPKRSSPSPPSPFANPNPFPFSFSFFCKCPSREKWNE